MTLSESRPFRAPTDEELAQDVLNHFATHPTAMDTVRGVAEWWLLQERKWVAVERLEAVLQRLTEQGVLDTVGEGPRRCYRRKAPVLGEGPGA